VGLLVLLLLGLAVAASIHQWVHHRQAQRQFERSIAISSFVADAQTLLEHMSDAQSRLTSIDAGQRDRWLPGVDQGLTAWFQRLDRLSEDDPSLRDHLAAVRTTLTQVRALLDQPIYQASTDADPDPTSLAVARERFAQAQLVFLRASQQALLAAGTGQSAAVPDHEANATLTASIGLAASALALVLGGLLWRMLRQVQLESHKAIGLLTELLVTDPLTGARNRRGLDEVLAVEMARARRSHDILSVAMIDLDYFKRYNSRRGHAGGDALLRTATQAWAEQLRPTDDLARYGGEEFTLVLPNCTCEQAIALIERLRPVVPDSQTFSAGIATWDEIEPASRLLQRADHALMQAKKDGRNRTIVAGREDQIPLELNAR
jgi:diguanylate cyclase (GGDEF)-like protein